MTAVWLLSGHRAAGGADADGSDEAGGRHRGREVRAEGRGEEGDHQQRAGGDRHAAVQVCTYKAANITTYRVDQKKVCSQKTKIGHGGGFLKKKSMTNKIKKFLYTL